MYTAHPKKEKRLVLFAKFFVLPILSIALIVFVINKLNSYSDKDEIIQKTESRAYYSSNKSNPSPKISSLSKGMDKK